MSRDKSDDCIVESSPIQVSENNKTLIQENNDIFLSEIYGFIKAVHYLLLQAGQWESSN